MTIRGITLEGVGKFAEKVRVEGLGPGVNMLSAENEAGKSTIFKALRACLFERHGTTNKEVKALATEGLSLPVSVSVELEADGSVYEISKDFLKSAKAELRRGGQTVARGREADEAVWELLGIQPGKWSADDAAFGLLWVSQGASFEPPTPAGEAEASLSRAVQAEVGEMVGGESAGALLQAVNAELGEQLTATGRPKAGGSYQTADARREALAADLAAAENRLQSLRQDIQNLENRTAERKRIQDPAETARLREELEKAREALRTGEEAARRVDQAATKEELARAQHDDCDKSLTELRRRAESIDRTRTDLAKRREELEALEPLEAEAKKKIGEAQAGVQQIDQAEQDRGAPRRRLERIAKALEQTRERAQLQKRAEQLGEIHGEMARVRRSLAGNPATAEALERLDADERKLDRLVAGMTAAAPVVEVALAAEAGGRVRVDGDALADSSTFQPTQPLRITLDGVATVTVSPPAGANDAERKQRKALESSISDVLAELGVKTPAEARAARAMRGKSEAALGGLESRLDAFEVSEKDLPAALADLRTRIETIDGEAQRLLTEEGLDALPSAEDVERQRSGLEEERAEAQVRRKELEGVLAAQNERVRELSGRAGELRQAVRTLQETLHTELALLPDEGRDGHIAEAEAALAGAKQDLGRCRDDLEQLRRAAPDESRLESLGGAVQRLEAARENRNRQIEDLAGDIARLEGRIENAGGEGLGEKVESLREQLELAVRDVERHKHRIATLELLAGTVEDCYEQQRDRLHAPLLERLRPFLHDVFPAADIELGDGFQIQALRRGGGSGEDLERLSDGTREQIAVLVRLAMGTLLCEQGVETPIILDDALVFSDDTRIERMFDALTRAGNSQQVIVFTCRTRTFATLGARPLTVRPAGG